MSEADVKAAAEAQGNTETEGAQEQAEDQTQETAEEQLEGLANEQREESQGALEDMESDQKEAEDQESEEGDEEGGEEKGEGEKPPLELKLPEGYSMDDPLVQAYSEYATKKGMSPEDAQDHLDFYVAFIQDKVDQNVQAAEEARLELEKDWGDQFFSEMAKARDAMRQIFEPELADFLDATGMGNNPALIKGFRKVYDLISGDGKFIPSDGGPGSRAKDGVERSIEGDAMVPVDEEMLKNL